MIRSWKDLCAGDAGFLVSSHIKWAYWDCHVHGPSLRPQWSSTTLRKIIWESRAQN